MPTIDSVLLQENIQFWKDRYVKNRIEWYIEQVNPMLLKHLRTLLPPQPPLGQESLKAKKFFIPLCGKTKDIPFLLSLGFQVFGVESVATAIVELGQENNLDIKFDQENSIYYTEDMNLKIYCGDLFTCPIEKWGPFDCVWDRGSFIAIDYPLRELYVDAMKRAVAYGTGRKFRYLLQAVRYDKNVYPGPPRAVDADDVAKFLKPWAKVDELEEYIVPEDSSMRKVAGNIDSEFHEVAIFLTNKE